jgi:hypothetical protein
VAGTALFGLASLAGGLAPNAGTLVGAALGIAVLSALATSRSSSLLASHAPRAVALTSGFHLALLVASVFLAAAAVIALRAANTRGEPTGEPADVGVRTAEGASVSLPDLSI